MNNIQPLTDEELQEAQRRGESPAAYANRRLKLGRQPATDALPRLPDTFSARLEALANLEM